MRARRTYIHTRSGRGTRTTHVQRQYRLQPSPESSSAVRQYSVYSIRYIYQLPYLHATTYPLASWFMTRCYCTVSSMVARRSYLVGTLLVAQSRTRGGSDPDRRGTDSSYSLQYSSVGVHAFMVTGATGIAGNNCMRTGVAGHANSKRSAEASRL